MSILGMTANGQKAATPAAQTAPAEPGSAYSVKSYSDEVLVDVVVSDAQGNPIRHLSPDHFQVLEDGKPQQFRFFQEHGVTPPSQTAPAPHPIAEHVYTNLASVEDHNAPLILLLDGLNTEMKDQADMRRQILAFIKQIPPGTHVAVFGLNRSMTQLAGFTTDTSAIAAAVVNAMSIRRSGMLYRDNHWQDPVDAEVQDQQSQAQGDSYVKVTEARRDQRRLEERVTYTLDAFDVLSKYLAGFQGRKNVVWFSASFPLDLAPKAVTSLAGSSEDASGSGANPNIPDSRQVAQAFVSADFSEQVRHTTSLLSVSRIAVYPVDVRGVEPDNIYGVEYGGQKEAGDGKDAAYLAQAMSNMKRDFVQNLNSEENSMKNIADATGGKAFLNGNEQSEALGKVLRNAAYYYETAYIPAHPRDGKYHTIRVSVNSPGARASYRQGYYGDDPGRFALKGSATADPLKPELQMGRPPSTQVPFFVRVIPLAPQPDLTDRSRRNGDFGAKIDGPVVRYSIDWNIDLGALQTTTAADGHREGKISFGGVVYDSEGKLRNSMLNTTDLNLTGQRFAQLSTNGLLFHQELDLPKANVVLRVALIDRSSGKTGSLDIPLTGK